jgi:hypothetical protein
MASTVPLMENSLTDLQKTCKKWVAKWIRIRIWSDRQNFPRSGSLSRACRSESVYEIVYVFFGIKICEYNFRNLLFEAVLQSRKYFFRLLLRGTANPNYGCGSSPSLAYVVQVFTVNIPEKIFVFTFQWEQKKWKIKRIIYFHILQQTMTFFCKVFSSLW